MDIEFAGLVGLGGAAIVAALVEVVKRVLALEETWWTRFLPVLALALGVGWNWLIGPLVGSELSWRLIVVYGLFSGLAAMGLYASQKTARGG